MDKTHNDGDKRDDAPQFANTDSKVLNATSDSVSSKEESNAIANADSTVNKSLAADDHAYEGHDNSHCSDGCLGVGFDDDELRCPNNNDICKANCDHAISCEIGIKVIKKMAAYEKSLDPERSAVKDRHDQMADKILEHCKNQDLRHEHYKDTATYHEAAASEAVSSGQVHTDELIETSFYGRASKAGEAQKIDDTQDYYKPWLESYPEDVPEFVDTHIFENLVELLENSVEKYGDNIAYLNMGSSMTYKELGAKVDTFAAYLQQELGLGKGDKIAIMMPNLMQFPVAFFGALKAGLTVSNINPLYTPRELKNQLENCDATTIVVVANYANVLEQIIHETTVHNVIITEVGDALDGFCGLKKRLINYAVRLKGMVPKTDKSHFAMSISFDNAMKIGKEKLKHFMPVQINYDDIALLQYTGGTTGRSKGAMLSHGNLIANIAQANGMYGPVLREGKETILTVIPIYHIFALTVNIILFLYLGGQNLLITDPRNIKAFAKEIRKHPEITALTGVNTLFNLIISHEEFANIKWQNLHLVIGGGAAVQSGVEQRFFEKTGFHILEGYGLTECSPLVAVCPYNVDHYTGSIGLIAPSTIARIVNSEGNEIKDTEQEGELEIKGPQVMHGYYKCDKHNDYIFDDGYVRTGDIAKWMPGGYIKLIDRLKDMILVSGFNVFPNEIEDVVSRFGRVLECAVIGIPSDSSGEAVKLFVVKADPSLTAAEVKQYCRAYLTPYKVPRIIQFVDTLPKSPLGKVLRRKLRDMEGANPLTAEQQLAAIMAGKAPHPDMAIATNVINKANNVLREREVALAAAAAYGEEAIDAQEYAKSAQDIAKRVSGWSTKTAAAVSGYVKPRPYHSMQDNVAGQEKNAYPSYELKEENFGAAPTLRAAKSGGSSNNALLSTHQAAASITGFAVSASHADKQETSYSEYKAACDQQNGVMHAAAATGLKHDKHVLPVTEDEQIAVATEEAVELANTQKKSAGALALEQLLSSHGDNGVHAATETPNIHKMKHHSAHLRKHAITREQLDKSIESEKIDHKAQAKS